MRREKRIEQQEQKRKEKAAKEENQKAKEARSYSTLMQARHGPRAFGPYHFAVQTASILLSVGCSSISRALCRTTSWLRLADHPKPLDLTLTLNPFRRTA